MEPEPIHVVREDGRIDRLGHWRAPRLTLELDGFPLLRPGVHELEGDLPWVFWEMCPSGFLGRAFALRHPELGLGTDPRNWGAAECLRALTTHGHDLPGNLVVGASSLEELQARRASPNLESLDVAAMVDQQLETLDDVGNSSLGGDRPKIAFGDRLIKYSPPLDTPLGRRWGDLLRIEALCLSVLEQFGIPAARVEPPLETNRTFLLVHRYDRTDRGRRGATTLYYFAAEHLGGDVSLPAPRVIRALVDLGHLTEPAFQTCTRLHTFSVAIGNTDAHLANYGLTFDEAGRAALAPAFDVLPMALAPRFDELPDARLRPRGTPIPEEVRPMVHALAARIDAEVHITSELKALWRSCVGV